MEQKKIFDNIRKQIAEYRTSEQYADSMCAMIAKEGDMKGAQICIAPEDMGLSDKLLAAAGEGASVAADDSVKLGGYLVLRRELLPTGHMTALSRNSRACLRQEIL